MKSPHSRRHSCLALAAATIETLENRTLLSAASLWTASAAGGGALMGPFARAIAPLAADVSAPQAVLEPAASANRGDLEYFFTVDYSDDVAIEATTIGNDDVLVTGPNGFHSNAIFVGDRSQLNSGPSVIALYAIDGPIPEGFGDAEAGVYTVLATDPTGPDAGPVADTSGNIVGGFIGTFEFQFPAPPGPDLAQASITYPAGQYAPGGAIVVQGFVKSRGTEASGPFQVVVSLVPELDFQEAPEVVLSTTDFSEILDPESSLPIKISAAIPTDIPSGNYFLNLHVIPPNATEGGPLDVDLTNNDFSSPTADVTIAEPLPAPPIGGLDTNFGTNGVVHSFTEQGTTAGVAVQDDGKTITIGDSHGTDTTDFAMSRFNIDGSLDTTFGGIALGGPFDGTVFTDFAGRDDHPIATRLLVDGRILVVGTSSSSAGSADGDIALVLYHDDGSLDTTFGTGGLVMTDLGLSGLSDDAVLGLTMLPDGRFVVSGKSNAAGTGDFALIRYNADGTLDTTFGGTGKVLTDFGGGDDSANAVAFDPKRGQLVVAGSATTAGDGPTLFAVARYNDDGSLDAKFGDAGKAVNAIVGVDDEAFAVAIGPRGEVAAAGAATNSAGTSTDFAAVRYSTKGALDRKFGVDGVVTVSFGQPAVANRIQIGADSSVLLMGATAASFDAIDPDQISIALAQLTPTGALDTTFASTGAQPGTAIIDLASAGSFFIPQSDISQSANSQAAALDFQVSAASQSQQALAVLAKQHAIAAALSGKLIVVSSSGGQTTIGQVAGSGPDLTGALVASLPALIVGGASKGSAVVTVTDSGNRAALGTVNITLLVSLDPNVDSGDTQLATLINRKLKLKIGQGKRFKAKFVVPATLADGNYFLVAQVEPAATLAQVSDTNDDAATTSSVPIAAPFLDFSGPPLADPAAAAPGAKMVIPVTITNDGNILAKGTIGIRVVAADPAHVAADVILADLPAAKIKLKPGTSKTIKVKGLIPNLTAPGSYILKATLAGGLAADDPTPENNILTAAGMLVVT